MIIIALLALIKEITAKSVHNHCVACHLRKANNVASTVKQTQQHEIHSN